MAKQAQNFPGASMNGEGMLFNGITFKPVVEACEGCGRIAEFEGQNFCSGYSQPAAKWALGACNFTTIAKGGNTEKARVNPQKASRRSAKR